MIVIVGSGPAAPRYTLPIALLRMHSVFFRAEIARLDANNGSSATGPSKKRKLSSEDDVMIVKCDESDNETAEASQKNEMLIKLADVDPTIFGLFLKFLYRGCYPADVDLTTALPTHNPHAASSVNGLPSGYAQAGADTANTNTSAHSQPPSALLPAAPRTTTSPSIPPSVHAWLLGQRLGSQSFMNYTISRIYMGIGTRFALMPFLVHYVWNKTAPASCTPSSTLFPNLLRKLLLDFLVINWSSENSRAMPKSPPLNAAWIVIFDTHQDLRRDFIFGLQGGFKMMPVQNYFLKFANPAAEQNYLLSFVNPAAEMGAGSEKEGEREVGALVAVKEEGNGVDGVEAEAGVRKAP